MKLLKEIPIISIVMIPFIYLAYIWAQLPEKVPMHWNINGEIDRYDDKIALILIPVLLPLLVYVIFLVVPKIDPKKKIKKMGNKFQTIKLLLTTFMSILAMYIIYSSKNESFSNPNYITLLLGVLFIVLGNYFKTIRANYFIGIRTPWTLESDANWKETHTLAGKMWFIGGLVIVLCSLLLAKQLNMIIFLTITGIIALVPVLYSYLLYTKQKKNNVEENV